MRKADELEMSEKKTYNKNISEGINKRKKRKSENVFYYR
jgi:hypothetical protein